MRITGEHAFVLHARPWRETSLLVEVLSEDHGRLGLVARRRLAAGEEVLVSYGGGCNARFLATYGFAPHGPHRDPPCEGVGTP